MIRISFHEKCNKPFSHQASGFDWREGRQSWSISSDFYLNCRLLRKLYLNDFNVNISLTWPLYSHFHFALRFFLEHDISEFSGTWRKIIIVVLFILEESVIYWGAHLMTYVMLVTEKICLEIAEKFHSKIMLVELVMR